ncbi:MAG: hypothetical protein WC797_01910 [Candidatus Paceibacterota bacterium]|jgi:hypothetical protein
MKNKTLVHHESCTSNDDTYWWPGPCTCGAEKIKSVKSKPKPIEFIALVVYQIIRHDSECGYGTVIGNISAVITTGPSYKDFNRTAASARFERESEKRGKERFGLVFEKGCRIIAQPLEIIIDFKGIRDFYLQKDWPRFELKFHSFSKFS